MHALTARSPRLAFTTMLIGVAFLLSSTPGHPAGLPCIGGCKFTVSGKKGPYAATIDAAKLAQSRKEQIATDAESKGVGDHALNKGAFSGFGLRMPKTEQVVRDMLVQIVQASGKFGNLAPQPRDVPIFIVATTDFGPTAQADGSIVIPLGMLTRSDSRDEIGWLLSHEYGHIVLAHFANDAAAQRRKQMLDTLVDVTVQGMELSRLRAQGNSGGVRLYSINDPEETKRVGKTETLQEDFRIAVQLHTHGVTRDQEDRADAAGIDFAMAAGWDADSGAQGALAHIAEDDARAALLEKSLSDQVKTLAVQSVTPQAANALNRGDLGGALTDWTMTFGRNALQAAGQQAITAMSANHRPTAQRQSGLHAYVHDAYSAIDREPDKAWMVALRATPEVVEADRAVNACDTAKTDLMAGNPDQALRSLQPALTTKYADAPFVADREARIYTELGDFTRADQVYDKAEDQPARPVATIVAARASRSGGRRQASSRKAASPSPAPVRPEPAPVVDPLLRQTLAGYQGHVALLTAHGAFAKAKLKIAEAERHFQDHEPFLPELIFMAFKSGDGDAYGRYLDECRRVQDDSLWERCKLAVLDDSQKQAFEKLTPEQRATMDRTLERREEENGRHQMWKHMLDTANKPESPS